MCKYVCICFCKWFVSWHDIVDMSMIHDDLRLRGGNKQFNDFCNEHHAALRARGSDAKYDYLGESWVGPADLSWCQMAWLSILDGHLYIVALTAELLWLSQSLQPWAHDELGHDNVYTIHEIIVIHNSSKIESIWNSNLRFLVSSKSIGNSKFRIGFSRKSFWNSKFRISFARKSIWNSKYRSNIQKKKHYINIFKIFD